MAVKFLKGQKYQAKIKLSGIEVMAHNNIVRDKLVEVGFKDVTVSGFNGERTAIGVWGGETQELDQLPSRIIELKAL